MLYTKKDGKIAAALGDPPPNARWLRWRGAPPPDSQVVTITQLNVVTFEHCSDFSASLKLRPITSYLSDGWAPLVKLAPPPLAQTSSYATAYNSELAWE